MGKMLTMSGIQFKLKKKGATETPRGIEKKGLPVTNKIGFKFAKKVSTPVQLKSQAQNLLNDDENVSDDEGKVINIDSFDKRKGGSLAGNKAIASATKPESLVIKPPSLNKSINFSPNEESIITKQREEAERKLQYGMTNFRTNDTDKRPDLTDLGTHTDTDLHLSQEDQIRLSVLNGESIDKSTGLVIPMNHDKDSLDEEVQDYEKVPVEQFGAALLRGMGWKPEPQKSKKSKKTAQDLKSKVETRKKSILLGIGAEAVESDVMEELVGKRGTRFEAPLIKREKM